MSCSFSILSRTIAVLLAAAAVGGGCAEVRGRKKVQEANELYKRGKYAEAVATYDEAAELIPELPTLWLNKGYTCRQLIAPGGKDPDSQKAAACALDAFKKLGQLAPEDPRADQLTIQTWFDIDDFSSLEKTFLERNRRTPDDVDVVRGLQEVYFKEGKWREALAWSKRAAALRPNDAETQYRVGTFIWQVLSARGGGPEMATHDPRPRLPPEAAVPEAAPGKGNGKGSARKRKEEPPVPVAPPPPLVGPTDITGAERVALADEGIAYLEKALALRRHYPEAMTYLNLLWRQKSFGLFTDPPAWQAAVDRADEWQRKALAARGGKS